MSKKAANVDPRVLSVPFACSIVTRIFKNHPNVTALQDLKWVPRIDETEFWFRDGNEVIAVDSYGRTCALQPSDDEEFPNRVITPLSKELHGLMNAFEDEEPNLMDSCLAVLSDEKLINKMLIESVINKLAPNWYKIQELVGNNFAFHFSLTKPVVTLYADNAVYYFTMKSHSQIDVRPFVFVEGCCDAKHVDAITAIVA